MSKIDIDKFIGSMISQHVGQTGKEVIIDTITTALHEQGLDIKDGKVVDFELNVPKFRIGDWIIGPSTCNCTLPILDIQEDSYKVGENECILFENEKFYRLWSIKDLKKGDVAVLEDKTFGTIIFKYAGITKNGNVDVADYYCAYNVDKELFFVKGMDYMGKLNLKFRPATKEEKKLLDEKMRWNRYAWDSQNKKLVKIEPLGIPKSKTGEYVPVQFDADAKIICEFNKPKLVYTVNDKGSKVIIDTETGQVDFENLTPELVKQVEDIIERIKKEYEPNFNKSLTDILSDNFHFLYSVTEGMVNDYLSNDILSIARKEIAKEIEDGAESMIDIYSNTPDYNDRLPVNCMVRAYYQGIRDIINKLRK